MAELEHPRLILPAFLSPRVCKELEFIHKSCSTVGYRPNVFATTVSHLIATNSSHLILPFIPLRERLKDKVEEFFACEFELFIEFTGLISWCKGAHIGWHSDDNRPYLKQRSFAAVCYLNSHGKDFEGGMFHFQDGDPTTILPMAGDVLIYTADSRNIHSVDEIINGERLTLTLWFTRERSHDEDVKLISLLSESPLSDEKPDSCLPLPAPNNMYWFSANSASHPELGFDIRWGRVHTLGYKFQTCDDMFHPSDLSFDPVELLNRRLRLAKEDEVFEMEFAESLHALQVLQFYFWKASELHQETKECTEMSKMRSSQLLKSGVLVLAGDHHLVEAFFGERSCDVRRGFDLSGLSAAHAMWEGYVRRMRRELIMSIPYWRSHQALYPVAPTEG